MRTFKPVAITLALVVAFWWLLTESAGLYSADCQRHGGYLVVTAQLDALCLRRDALVPMSVLEVGQ